MGRPVVVVANGGLAITEVANGLPVDVAGNGYGLAVTVVAAGGMPVTGSGGGSPIAPTNSVAPVITGNLQVGQILGVNSGSWTNSPTGYTFQWKRGGTNIASATSSTYTLVEADAGQSITCAVTATNGAGSTTANSNALLIDVYIVFLTSIADPTDLTTYSGGSWNAVNFGVAAANRRIVLSIGGRNTTANRTISSASFGGVSAAASALAQTGGATNLATAQIWAAAVPTGTSGNLSVTWSAAQLRCGAGVYAVYGAASNVADVSTNFAGTTQLDVTSTMNLPSGAAVVGYSFINGGSPTWDIGLTQNFSAAVESTISHSGASGSYSGAGTTSVGLTWGTNTDSSAPTVFAAWAPSGAAVNASDVITANGVRTWFNSPSTAVIGGNLVAGYTATGGGNVTVSDGTTTTILKSLVELDDHDTPGIIKRSSDSKVLTSYAKHSVDSNYYVRISSAADSIAAFDVETNIGAGIGTGFYWTYSNIVEVTDGIFIFLRGQVISDLTFKQFFIKSTDNGATWSAGTIWFNGPERPYFQITKTAANRFDIICNDGNPDIIANNSLYHFYYEAGVWKKSNGTNIGSPPFTTSQFTKIYDGSSVRAWPWDLKLIGGTLRAAYAVFPSTTDHRYRYASLSGGVWSDAQICTAGGTIYASAGTEDYYSGGITLDPDDATKIICCRQVGTPGPGGGAHQIFKGITADGGATWTMTQLTAGGEKKFRPAKIAGSSVTTFLVGRYTTYTNWATRLQKMTV